MGSHMIDSMLFCDVFSTEMMRNVFDDNKMMQNWLDIEAALAESQGELGIIPEDAAMEISKKAKVEKLDINEVKKGMAKTAHSLVPTIREFQRICDGNAGEYIHLGATTQDILDTGFVLSAKEAFEIIYRDLFEIEEILIQLAEKHKNTMMTGRTHGQHALPITFGYKVAVWASEVRRHLDRMEECKERVFVGQMGGAVGTMAGFGPKAFEVERRTLEKLGLGVPDIPWHVSRDRFIEVLNIIAMVAGTFGKIGNEIYTLQKTEVAELSEPFVKGMVGSSTMPHKRNPGLCENMNTLSKVVKSNLTLVHEAMFQEHERDGGFWKVEWIAVPEAFIFTGAILSKAKKVLNGLIVDESKMRENLFKLKGLLLSEAIMLALGEKIGKQTAHEIVYEISMEAFEKGISMKEIMMADKRITSNLTEEEIDRALDPSLYTGHSCDLVDRVIKHIEACRK